MNFKARITRLEQKLRSLRPSVLFLFDGGPDAVRSNLHTGTMTDEEALDLLDAPPAPLRFAIMTPEPQPDRRGVTWEELQAENEMTDEEFAALPHDPDRVEVVDDPWDDVDMDAARALVSEAMDLASKGLSLNGLDLSSVYKSQQKETD